MVGEEFGFIQLVSASRLHTSNAEMTNKACVIVIEQMDTDTLRWFQLVADGMTLTEVADIHAASQPGVSRALSRLEAEVGTPLLQKNGRVLRVTHAGSVFKRHVDGLLHRLDDGLAAVNELVDPETGTVTVAFQTTLGTWLVPGHIGQFRQQHPRVQFRLVRSDDAQGSSLLAGGRIDLEFTARRPRNPTVHWERLFAQPLALAVPAQHRAAERSQISLSEVADCDFVMLRPSWTLRGLTDELCSDAGFAPQRGPVAHRDRASFAGSSPSAQWQVG